ncbi:uncharacterized protein LOC135392294 [Ornithodoros turicata]|uniref:uncharacterized protein LOC135392294 n=1 Tax=Ornithodoros turicata TaxID=34597 RepID=UPI0031387A51
MGDKQWFEGPPWLSKSEEFWPISTENGCGDLSHIEEERKRGAILTTYVQATVPALLDLGRYGDYQRIIRITAWILRFIENSRATSKVTGPLTAMEVEKAEIFWIRRAQNESYPEEFLALRQRREIAQGSKIARLRPHLDERDVMRLSGRLQYSDNPEEVKHPILMAKEHPLSALLVDSVHRRALHSGVQTTLTILRERWWITQARQLVKSTLYRCKVCRRLRATKATAPIAPLPVERLNPTHPFDTTGIDFAGPLYLKTSSGSAKAYIALFTCATTRAVHLELVTDLTTKSFVMAFRRFISRRGAPSTIYSDNALTFKKAAQDIKKLWTVVRSTDAQDFAAKNRISWKFIVERAAWWGGMWERLVRSVKTCLRRVLGRQCLTSEEMTTLLHEVEAVVNSRPLTYLHSTPDEPSALTPAHLLIGRNLSALPEVSATTVVPRSNSTVVSRRWIHRQKLADQFWKRWKHEYLLELRSAHQSDPKSRTTRLSQGDVVLVQEDKVPRHMWRLARITQLFRGRDDLVRSCELRLVSGRLTRRPVQLLYPLETAEK